MLPSLSARMLLDADVTRFAFGSQRQDSWRQRRVCTTSAPATDAVLFRNSACIGVHQSRCSWLAGPLLVERLPPISSGHPPAVAMSG